MNDIKRYNERLKKILSPEELTIVRKDRYRIIDFGYEYVDIGQYRKAFELFNIGVKLNGYDPDILNGLGITLCEMGRFKSALTILKKAVQLYPHDALILANLGNVYWEICEYEKALYYYYKSLRLNPSISEIYYNIISVYYEMGEFLMAYIACLQYLEKFPPDEQIIELRNDILINLGISLF
ncbi:MAG: tetratricopeptide repeat protein [Spirochaetes bacterium]|nr:tetratricopeptide repeat protein [Spirochaetota bacterium]